MMFHAFSSPKVVLHRALYYHHDFLHLREDKPWPPQEEVKLFASANHLEVVKTSAHNGQGMLGTSGGTRLHSGEITTPKGENMGK